MGKVGIMKNGRGDESFYINIPISIVRAKNIRKGDEVYFYMERNGMVFLDHKPAVPQKTR